jgi:hypothetical protein
LANTIHIKAHAVALNRKIIEVFMLSIVKRSGWLLPIIIAFAASQAFAHGMTEAEKQTIIEGGNIRYLWIGATHMLSGYDHLAFVFGIIFFLGLTQITTIVFV